MPSTSPTEDEVKRSTTISKEQAAQNVKDIARIIREQSAMMSETVKFMRESGAIIELTEAIKAATIAARDATREINETAKELKDRGVFRDTASAVDETTRTAKEAFGTMSAISEETRQAAPDTAAEIGKAAGTLKQSARATAQKAKERMKKEKTETT
jgi:hypothetical protein